MKVDTAQANLSKLLLRKLEMILELVKAIDAHNMLEDVEGAS
jgi:hypothetical protein